MTFVFSQNCLFILLDKKENERADEREGKLHLGMTAQCELQNT